MDNHSGVNVLSPSHNSKSQSSSACCLSILYKIQSYAKLYFCLHYFAEEYSAVIDYRETINVIVCLSACNENIANVFLKHCNENFSI